MQGAGLDGLVVTHSPNLRYLTGLSASSGAVVLGGRPTLVVDFRYLTAAQAIARDLFVVEVAEGQLDEKIVEVVKGCAFSSVGVEAEYLTIARFNRLAAALARPQLPLGDERAAPALRPVERLLSRIRAVKDEKEIEILREAGRRLSAVGCELRRWARIGRTELEVAADIDEALRRGGFERPAFETIVASGPNGALPHARPTSRRLEEGDGVVLDFGGVYDGYCVDLTRTISLGPMREDYRRMFDAVREAQAAALAAVQPGVPAVEIDAEARRVLSARGFGDAFGHGTGHGLGLEVHEEPRLSRQTPPEERIEAGMVFTIEPGAYVPGLGGVRIEDDVLVRSGGSELLTSVPIEL